MAKRLKRPRDPVQLGKLIGDILTGQVEDARPSGRKKAARTPAEPAVDLATMDGDERILLQTRKIQEARTARLRVKTQARRSTKGN